MPDIKTALTTALTSWEQDDQKIQQEKKMAHRFTSTNNVTTETFSYVQNHPMSTSSEVCDALLLRGFKKSSVGSLLTQFVKQGQMSRSASGKYKTIVPAYMPLKSNKKLKESKNKIVTVKPKTKAEGIAALAPQVTATTQWDAETIINNIGLKQARALYDELKKLFGG